MLLPLLLVFVRMAAFIGFMPLFSWVALPRVSRVGLVLLLTVFFAAHMPRPTVPPDVDLLTAFILILQEATTGVAIALAARLIYLAVQQGAMMAAQQMGFGDPGIFDPVTGTPSRPLASVFEMIFALLFFGIGGHHLLLAIMFRSFEVFPLAGGVNVPALAGGIAESSSQMLTFALELAAPVLAAFLIIGTLLALTARVMPEMNILLASFPLRVGLGLLMALAIMPSMQVFTEELARWMHRNIAS